MYLLDVSQRPDRHRDLLDEAEAFGPRALIYFERGDSDSIQKGNRLAQDIRAAPGGDIGWQVVDIGIMLTKHRSRLAETTQEHLKRLLVEAIPAWSDREFGRGNVNHPVIATWIYAAAGAALERPDLSKKADRRLESFIHTFSQAGDMSEYNSPTYLGPTLVGLANTGMHAALESTRVRARLIEERIWLSVMARWHPPTRQLAGPHSRAYADSTLGFGGIIRYLCHAVLADPVFWDAEMALAYDHEHDAEWAAKIAASTFCFPDYLRRIGEQKILPYTVFSTTDGEDYAVDRQEVYRGGWGQLTTYLASQYCLGSSERPYVDGGQSEGCIAYWTQQEPVAGFYDLRSLYFRYVANNRLPGQENLYHNWYGGKEKTYSANLLHQDGRLHVLQHKGKAILLAQPLKRENGYLRSLRFDALLPLYTPLDEIWVGDQKVDRFPWVTTWNLPITICDHETYISLQPLKPTVLDGSEPSLEISTANNHLIISSYNLRGDHQRHYPPQVLDHTHNGFLLEIGSKSEYESFSTFRRHIAHVKYSEQVRLEEFRQIHYVSGEDELFMEYHPATQMVTDKIINGEGVQVNGFRCPDAIQNAAGGLFIRGAALQVEQGVIAWLACDPASEWTTAALPTDHLSQVRLATRFWTIETPSFAAGRIQVRTGEAVQIEIDTVKLLAPLRLSAAKPAGQVVINGRKIEPKALSQLNTWELA